MRDLSLKAVISILFLFLFFLAYMYRKVWMLAFNVTRITSFLPLDLKLYTKYRLEVKSANVRHGLEHSLNYLQFMSF
jgi:hypothetical protein